MHKPMYIMLIMSWFCRSCVNKQINNFFKLKRLCNIFSLFFRMYIVPFLNQIYITALVHWMSACVSTSYKKSSVRVDWKKCVYRSLQIMINLLAASIHQACRMVWIIIIICIYTLLVYIYIILSKTPRNLDFTK